MRFFIAILTLSLITCVLAKEYDSIAVVGGGWSGLFTLHHLVANGFTNLTLFESTSRLGGYTTSISIPTNSSQSFDAAVFASTLAQWKFLALANKIGVQFCPLISDTVRRSPGPPRIIPTSTAFAQIAATQLGDPDQVRPAIGKSIKRYTELWASLMKIPFIDTDLRTARLFPTIPSRSIRRQLSIPAKTWLAQNDLQLLEPVFRLGGDAQAYGPIETTPILYYFTFLTPQVLAAFASGMPASFVICDPSQSYQTVFNAIFQSLRPHVTLCHETPITAVRRRKKGGVKLVASDGSKKIFDAVFVTSKLSGDLNTVSISPALFTERLVKRTVTTLRLFVALMRRPEKNTLVSNAPISYDENALKGIGGLFLDFFGARNVGRQSNGLTYRLGALYFYRERDFGEIDTSTLRQKIKNIRNGFALWDTVNWQTIFSRTYSAYFQRWSPKNVRRALPWALEKIQGYGGVYYVNSAACGFESVGHLLDCAERVVKKI